MVARNLMIVKFFSKKCVAEIEKLVDVTYVSPKRKYLLFYCNSNEACDITAKIMKIKGVGSVEESLVDMTQYDFEE